ncbi:hypothetical protein HPG69_004786 [Diceros bicornis minor]|uniref:Uncharacterized protein n=1 Tax=Diceros bicornis minor TaxID=77932 RepID=A0A7J7E4N8_DICBM|nr:hypothetical protein HPG69_004786 [Diceros bicornis minor]
MPPPLPPCSTVGEPSSTTPGRARPAKGNRCPRNLGRVPPESHLLWGLNGTPWSRIGSGGGEGPGGRWDRAEARPERKSQMPLLLSFGAPVCFPSGFGCCEQLSLAEAAAGGWSADGDPFLLASRSPTSCLPLRPPAFGPKACAKLDLSLLKRENSISRRHLHSLVVLKTILHLLNNANISYSSMFVMKSFQTKYLFLSSGGSSEVKWPSTEGNKNLSRLLERRGAGTAGVAAEPRVHRCLAPSFRAKGSVATGPESRGPASGRMLARRLGPLGVAGQQDGQGLGCQPRADFLQAKCGPHGLAVSVYKGRRGFGDSRTTPYWQLFAAIPGRPASRSLSLPGLSGSFCFSSSFLLQSCAPPGSAMCMEWGRENLQGHLAPGLGNCAPPGREAKPEHWPVRLLTFAPVPHLTPPRLGISLTSIRSPCP